MPKPIAEEKALVCPWNKGLLASTDEKRFKETGHNAVWCGGEHIDALLDEGEKGLPKVVSTSLATRSFAIFASPYCPEAKAPAPTPSALATTSSLRR